MARPSRLLNTKKNAAATKAVSDQNASTSPFLKLPPEIRNRIYHYALGNRDIHIYRGVWYSHGKGPVYHGVCMADHANTPWHKQLDKCYYSKRVPFDKHIPFALLQVSRQIYQEAALIPYATNTFVIDTSCGCFDTFASKLMPIQKRSIKDVRLIVWKESGYEMRLSSTLARGFTELSSLSIRIDLKVNGYLGFGTNLEHLSKAFKPFGRAQLQSAEVEVRHGNGSVMDRYAEWTAELKKDLLQSNEERERKNLEQRKKEEDSQAHQDQRRSDRRANRGLRALSSSL